MPQVRCIAVNHAVFQLSQYTDQVRHADRAVHDHSYTYTYKSQKAIIHVAGLLGLPSSLFGGEDCMRRLIVCKAFKVFDIPYAHF